MNPVAINVRAALTRYEGVCKRGARRIFLLLNPRGSGSNPACMLTGMSSTARVAIGWIRIAIGTAAIFVVAYAYFEGFLEGRTNPFHHFGYFTNQTSLATGAILIATGTLSLRGRSSQWLTYARAIAVSCMIIVAVVYNGIVPGTGAAVPWVSAALHIALPLYAITDWALVKDRPRLPWRTLWVILPYPLAWLSIVLVRGVTDGWVPYGFLLPDHGVATLTANITGLIAALFAVGALTWAASRLEFTARVLK